ncbi:MAG: histidine decarboxylase, pyruvoyl type [Patescibacteria group bacterium]|nr:histidine decarboxylase, pyruvoyl type [Patescibacteria group bacterium]
MRNVEKIAQRAIAVENSNCEGFFAGVKHKNYFLGVNYALAVVDKEFSYNGCSALDKTNAFDSAEIAHAHLGQINMIKVSSFCGPKGIIWGYDVSHVEKRPSPWNDQITDKDLKGIKIYDAAPLRDAFKKLLGSVSHPRFTFQAGSHVPCALKSLKTSKRGIIYAAVGIAIPHDREKNACLIMEDIGRIPEKLGRKRKFVGKVANNIARSIIAVGKNQKVKYKEIFIGIEDIQVKNNQVGCALVAMPYFVLAKNAYPTKGKLSSMTIKNWEKILSKNK